MPVKFKPGDMLRVTPAAEAMIEDPVAKEHAGQRCRYVSCFDGTVYEYCYVQFSTKGRLIPIRAIDLKADKETK